MKMDKIRKIAATWGVNVKSGRPKQDIIRDIQVKEGFSPCFGTKVVCEKDCLWKSDCIGKTK